MGNLRNQGPGRAQVDRLGIHRFSQGPLHHAGRGDRPDPGHVTDRPVAVRGDGRGVGRGVRPGAADPAGAVRPRAQPGAAADAVGDGLRRAGGPRRHCRDQAERPEQAPLPGRPHAVRAGQPRRGVPRGRPALRPDPGRRAQGRRAAGRPGLGVARRLLLSAGPAGSAPRRSGRSDLGEVARRHAAPCATLGFGGVAMDFLQPASWDEALAAKAASTAAVPIAGGTDVMVELNFDRRRPEALLDLTRVAELTGWTTAGGKLRVGAGMTYAALIGELGSALPGLALAARTVGSPQIRNRGTIGGNLGSASPAGDCPPPLLAADAQIEVATVRGTRMIAAGGFYTRGQAAPAGHPPPPLLAADAQIEVASVRGTRMIAAGDFYTGVKRSALAADELIAAVWISPPDGPEQFAKIGTRNAMVIAVAAFSLALHPQRKAVGTGIGSAAPTPVRAPDAEDFLAAALDEAGLWESRAPIGESVVTEFGTLVSAAARPIDDVRGTAAYRRHALAVLARRTLTWAWADYCAG